EKSLPEYDFLSREMRQMIMTDSVSENSSMEKAVRKKIRQYLEDYKEQLSSMKEAGIELNSPTFQYELAQQMSVTYNENGFLVLSSFFFDYSGGAHPNHGTNFVCLDVRMRSAEIGRAHV